MEVETNGHHTNGHSEKRRETSEERRIRKEKEKKARANETEEERRIRKEKEKSSSHRKETEEERRIRKEKEKQNGGGDKRKETEEERRIRKEKERARDEEKRAQKNKERGETEEERRIRKEKERAARENGDHHKRKETEEERRIRKEKERNGEKRKETEEERRIRKEKEKNGSHRKETEEERAARKERERKEKKHETEEERHARKERERKERKEKEEKEKKKEEPLMELGDDFFAAEEARLEAKNKKRGDSDEEENGEEEQNESQEEEMDEDESMKEDVKEEAGDESEEDTKQGIIMQPMEDSDDDLPLAKRKKPAVKRKVESGDESDDEPKKKSKGFKREPSFDPYEDEEDDYERPSKKMKRPTPKNKKGVKKEEGSPQKKMTKKEKELEEEKKVWKWWEEDSQLPEGVKWRFLEHKGPYFCVPYEPLPEEVRFWYDGKVLRLTEETEECATFYGRMLDHDYTTKEVFNKNFFKDWRKTMTPEEKEIIRDLSKCDFSEIDAHFKKYSEERKNRSKEEKDKEKAANAALVEEYGFCTMDGHRERIGNFRTEPPSLFRGRGEHPKQGMIKRRVMPEDVIINCSKDSTYPKPPPGHKWKKVQHDNTVTWLASWTENIQGQIKYVMLNPSSRLKGEKDWQKYEKARKLKGEVEKIREDYMADMKSKEMRVRQRAVALYFIDKLALRAGNEKDGDEQADTVGCCSLRVEHIELHEQKDGKEYVVEFDFLGKDSIRYNNEVPVDKRVFKNVKLFMENKKDGDDLFDRLNTSVLNQYLNGLMDGLTAKVFRTFNASFTLQQQLDDLTDKDDNLAAKMLSYNRANRAVAILCNHQRAVPKTHDKAMENLDQKLEAKAEAIKKAEKELKHLKKAAKSGGDKGDYEKKKKAVQKLLEQVEKLEIQKTDKHENKTIALGTSKLNYLDPRISVQWCKTHEVPIEKVYTKTHREKFRWAIDMIMNDDEVFHF